MRHKNVDGIHHLEIQQVVAREQGEEVDGLRIGDLTQQPGMVLRDICKNKETIGLSNWVFLFLISCQKK